MRITSFLASVLLGLLVAACSGTETQPTASDEFAAGNYRYFKWRSEPLRSTTRSGDPTYKLDPVVRREVNAALVSKGYILDPEQAQFSVDYIFAMGITEGQESQVGSNITPYPTVLPNRQKDQASVDNAIALGGVRQTSNIALQFNDVARKAEVWHVVITKIVEDANMSDTPALEKSVRKAINQGLRTLPRAE